MRRSFSKAAEWLEANHTHDDFYLHLDCFDPHEPWDPPEEYVKMFDPRGYDVDRFIPQAPYDEWDKHMTEDQKVMCKLVMQRMSYWWING